MLGDESLDGVAGQRCVAVGGEQKDAAREAMLKLFALLGDDDPLTIEFRRRLAAALF